MAALGVVTMTMLIKLSSDKLRCHILPELGGCLSGLWLGDTPVLRPTQADELQSARQSSSYVLVPYSNRIGHACLHWAGARYPLTPNNAPEPHTIHGIGWQHPWQVQETTPHSALLSFQHQADDAWPFDFAAWQGFALADQSLTLTLRITNQSNVPAPVGLGWHPYFVKREPCHISFEAKSRWEMSEEKLPTRRLPVDGLDTDCCNLDIDHCFDGWGGVVHLHDEQLHTQISAQLSHLVVFTKARLVT